jgi:hypothetical protein
VLRRIRSIARVGLDDHQVRGIPADAVAGLGQSRGTTYPAHPLGATRRAGRGRNPLNAAHAGVPDMVGFAEVSPQKSTLHGDGERVRLDVVIPPTSRRPSPLSLGPPRPRQASRPDPASRATPCCAAMSRCGSDSGWPGDAGGCRGTLVLCPSPTRHAHVEPQRPLSVLWRHWRRVAAVPPAMWTVRPAQPQGRHQRRRIDRRHSQPALSQQDPLPRHWPQQHRPQRHRCHNRRTRGSSRWSSGRTRVIFRRLSRPSAWRAISRLIHPMPPRSSGTPRPGSSSRHTLPRRAVARPTCTGTHVTTTCARSPTSNRQVSATRLL